MRRVGLLMAALLVFPWLAGCSGQPNATGVGLGEPFTLSPGQSASIAGEGLAVRFVQVIGDSRCPRGATCIWAGEVSCQLEITYEDATNTKVLVQPGLSPPAQADFANYNIAFDVQPYPEVGKRIDKGDYRLQLTITKANAAADRSRGAG
jgi:hypothetical protein